MANPFRTAVGRVCRNEDCTLNGRSLGLHLMTCESCNQQLQADMGWNRKAIAVASLAASLAIGLASGGGILLRSTLEAGREARLLADAEARFLELLPPDVAADPPRLAAQVQAEFSLSDQQRDAVLAAVEPRLATLPRALGPELAARFGNLLRTALRDGFLSAEEEAARSRFLEEERLEPATVQGFEAELRSRLATARACISKSQLRIAKNQVDEARQELVQATIADPDDPIAWANLGAATALLGLDGEARTAYERAIALDPNCWLAHYNLGLGAARTGDREGALRHLASALGALGPELGRERSKIVEQLLTEPAFAALRADPRFPGLLAGSDRRQVEAGP